jgi:hypothetical protein
LVEGGEIGALVDGVGGHRGGHLAQLGKAVDPEELVEIEVAAFALGRVAVGRERVEAHAVERGPVFGKARQVQHDRVALQFHPGHALDPAHDLAAELVGLALAGRQENLVARLRARQHILRDLCQRLARKIPCRADLPALEDLARALVAVVPPVFLISEIAGVEVVEQGLPLFGAEEILALVRALGLGLLVSAWRSSGSDRLRARSCRICGCARRAPSGAS